MSLLPIQTQPFTLYGNGCLIGDTTLILASFNDINGSPIPMQGTVMTGTVEPGSGTNEEQIIFTGLTTNANGTVTLTGVSSVGFASPYTQTSGFLKSHFGGTTFVLSDTAYLYSQYANVGASNTFTGTTTFTISPIIPTVSSSATNQAASIGYVNSVSVGAGAVKASNTVFGISELSVAPVTASVPIAIGQNDPILPSQTQTNGLVGNGGTPSGTNTFVTQQGLQNGTETFAVATGSSTAYAASFVPIHSSYVKGQLYRWQANVSSGISPTLNVDGLGAKNIYKQTTSGTSTLAIGDIGTSQMVISEYDGQGIQLLSPVSTMTSFLGKFTSGASSRSTSGGAQTIAHGLGVIPKFIRITWMHGNGGTAATIFTGTGVYNGTTVSQIYQSLDGVNDTQNATDTINIITVNTGATNNGHSAVPTFDATNITLTWTIINIPTTTNFIWEAYA